jgi:hypothetical protein
VSWKWTRLRAVLVTLGVVCSSEDDVELLTGGHAAVIFLITLCVVRNSEDDVELHTIIVVVGVKIHGSRLHAGNQEPSAPSSSASSAARMESALGCTPAAQHG